MVAKLTKTQRSMLKRAAANRQGIVAAQHGYRTGARRRYGSRDSRTLCQLRDLGLVGKIEVSSSRHYYGRGECDHYTEAWATITDAGREAIR